MTLENLGLEICVENPANTISCIQKPPNKLKAFGGGYTSRILEGRLRSLGGQDLGPTPGSKKSCPRLRAPYASLNRGAVLSGSND